MGMQGHTATFLPDINSIMVFGGCYTDMMCFNEISAIVSIMDFRSVSPNKIWMFSVSSSQWTLTRPSSFPPHLHQGVLPFAHLDSSSSSSNSLPLYRPEARGHHSATRIGNTVYFFGGSNNGQYFSDILAFSYPHLWWTKLQVADAGHLQRPSSTSSISSSSQLELSSSPLAPSGRDRHSAVRWHNRIIIFGGYTVENGGQYSDETWEFDTSTSSFAKLRFRGKKPQARGGHSAVVWDDRMYVFGGSNERETLQEQQQ
eukprot:jgi/Bigna1/74925/fgenesh1_pg.31_\